MFPPTRATQRVIHAYEHLYRYCINNAFHACGFCRESRRIKPHFCCLPPSWSTAFSGQRHSVGHQDKNWILSLHDTLHQRRNPNCLCRVSLKSGRVISNVKTYHCSRLRLLWPGSWVTTLRKQRINRRKQFKLFFNFDFNIVQPFFLYIVSFYTDFPVVF